MNEKAQKIADFFGVWVARDYSGDWYWYDSKPKKIYQTWLGGNDAGLLSNLGDDDWETSLHWPEEA